MRNEPAGTPTISGHLSHSLKTSFGLSPHSSPAVSGFGPRSDDRDAIAAPALPHGLAGCGGFAPPPGPSPPPAPAPRPRAPRALGARPPPLPAVVERLRRPSTTP